MRHVLEIPSYSSREEMVVEFIENFCKSNDFSFEKDYKGNIYVTKGSAEYYPCVVAHMDTVHKDQVELIDKRTLLDILEFIDGDETILSALNPVSGEPTGIGGDDKCGVYICLELLNTVKNIKAAFFVEEECGMLGSKNLHTKFFKDVGYALQFDAPTKNWFSYSCSGVKLWSEEFFESIQSVLDTHKVDNISIDPFTDVVQLRKYFDFCCAVLPSGYYDQHSASEFVIEEHTTECVEIGKKFIELLGESKYLFKDNVNIFREDPKDFYDTFEFKRISDDEDFKDILGNENILDYMEYEDFEKNSLDDFSEQNFEY